MAEMMNQAQNAAGNVGQQASSIANDFGQRANQMGENISSGIADLRSNIGNAVGDFSSQGIASGASDFVNSNSIIAKFVFLILVLIAFMFFVNLGIKFVGYVTSPQMNPYIIYGMIPGNTAQTISQDPKIAGAATVLRSNNKGTGLEFTWSMWLLVTGTNAGTKKQHIFNKGNSKYDSCRNRCKWS